MTCTHCGHAYIGRPSACPHCGAPIGKVLMTRPMPASPAEAENLTWHNLNEQMIVSPSFLGQSEPPSYLDLRWIRTERLTTIPFIATAATGELLLSKIPPRERWRLTRLIYGGPTNGTVFQLFAGGSSYGNGVINSDLFDIAQTLNGFAIKTDCDKALLPSGATLRALFSGATANDLITVTAYIDIYILETIRGRPGGGDNEALD